MRDLCKEVFERCLTELVAVFGAGKGGRFIAEMLCDMGCDVDFFIDNDIQKQGKQMGMVYIISPEQFAEIDNNFWVLLSVKSKEIEKQLLDLGVSSDHIVDLSDYSRGKVLFYFDEFSQKRFLKEKYRFLLEEDKRALCTAVSKLEFYDGILLIRGWAIPSDYIDKVTIKVNENTEILALREERIDVIKDYPYHKAEKCGYFYIGGTGLKEDISVEISFWKGDIFLNSIIKQCEYQTAFNILNNYCNEGKYEELLRSVLRRKRDLLQAKESVAEVLRDYSNKFVKAIDRLFMYKLLYCLNIFEKRDMESYLKLIESLDDIEAQAWLCEQEIPWMFFLYPQLKTEEIFCWQRRMYHYIASKMFAEKKEQKKADKNKIVILVDNLASAVYASAIFEIAIANELQKRGYKILMVVMDTSFSSDLQIMSCVVLQRNSKQYENQHISMKNFDGTIYYCQKEKFQERKIEAYNVIEEYEPEAIIDISLAGLIVSAALFQHQFKIIHISLSGYSSGAVFDRYIAKNKELCQIDNKIYHSINEEQVFEAPIKIPYNLSVSVVFHRQDYGISDDDFVLVTVGSRLQYEIDAAFLMHMRNMLCINEKMSWIIVGKDLGSMFYDYLSSEIERGQIIEWGFEQHLSSLYQICDVYVNPDRLGGCGSVELAMEYGIPIAMTKKMSDVAPVIKSENCKQDYDEMFLYIAELFQSKELRMAEGQKMKKLVNRDDLTIEHFVDVLIEAYQDCGKRRNMNE